MDWLARLRYCDRRILMSVVFCDGNAPGADCLLPDANLIFYSEVDEVQANAFRWDFGD